MKNDIFSDKGFCIILSLVAVIFCLQANNLCSFIPVDEDDSHYLYAAQLLGQGLIPYRDFVLVHPPLLIIIGALFFRCGLPTQSVQILFLVLNLSILFLVYSLGKLILRDSWAAVGAVVLLLFSAVLFGYDFRTMALRPFAILFILWGALEYYKGRPWFTGILFALSGLTIYLSALPVAMLCLLFCVLDGRKGIYTLAGLSGGLILGFGAFSFVPGFWNLTLGFQMGQLSGNLSRLDILTEFVRLDGGLFLAFLVGLGLAIWRKERQVFLFGAMTTLLFVGMFFLGGRMKSQNFEMVVPFMALVGAYTFSLLRGRIRAGILALLLVFGLWYQIVLTNPLIVLRTHAILSYNLTLVLQEVPQPCQTGRSPMIAMQTGVQLPRWYYGSDFWYFLHSGKYRNPANWREMLDNANSILWQKGLWDMMPTVVRSEIEREFFPARACGALVWIRKKIYHR